MTQKLKFSGANLGWGVKSRSKNGDKCQMGGLTKFLLNGGTPQEKTLPADLYIWVECYSETSESDFDIPTCSTGGGLAKLVAEEEDAWESSDSLESSDFKSYQPTKLSQVTTEGG